MSGFVAGLAGSVVGAVAGLAGSVVGAVAGLAASVAGIVAGGSVDGAFITLGGVDGTVDGGTTGDVRTPSPGGSVGVPVAGGVGEVWSSTGFSVVEGDPVDGGTTEVVGGAGTVGGVGVAGALVQQESQLK